MSLTFYSSCQYDKSLSRSQYTLNYITLILIVLPDKLFFTFIPASAVSGVASHLLRSMQKESSVRPATTEQKTLSDYLAKFELTFLYMKITFYSYLV